MGRHFLLSDKEVYDISKRIAERLERGLQGRRDEVISEFARRTGLAETTSKTYISACLGNGLGLNYKINTSTRALHALNLQRVAILYQILGISQEEDIVALTKKINSNFHYSSGESRNIREATMNDLDMILEMNEALFVYDSQFDDTLDKSWVARDGKEYFSSRVEEGSAWVATVDDVIVGYLVGSLTEGEDYRQKLVIAELENMFIDEDSRRKGIGKGLYTKFEKWARDKKADRLKVVASAMNHNAIGFYEERGFEDYTLTMERKL